MCLSISWLQQFNLIVPSFLLSLLILPTAVFAQFDIDSMLDDAGIQVQGDRVELRTGDASITTDGTGTELRSSDSVIETDQNTTRLQTPDARIETNTRTSGTQDILEIPPPSSTPSMGETRVEDARVDILANNPDLDTTLSIRVMDGTINESSIDLRTDGEVLIQSEEDVRVFTSIAARRPGVSEATVSTNEISVTYTDSGRLFGVFPVTLQSRVYLDSNGAVQVKRPWYSFLVFGTKQTTIVERISDNLTSTSATTVMTPIERAEVVDVFTESVSIHVGNSVSLITDDTRLEVGADGSVEMRVQQ